MVNWCSIHLSGQASSTGAKTQSLKDAYMWAMDENYENY